VFSCQVFVAAKEAAEAVLICNGLSKDKSCSLSEVLKVLSKFARIWETIKIIKKAMITEMKKSVWDFFLLTARFLS
jgi:hypothetical protein